MANLLVGISMISIATAATTNFLITTLTKTSESICCYMKRIAVLNHPCIVKITTKLEKIDLKFSIDVIKELIKEHDGREVSLALKQTLFGVNEILEKIENELESISLAVEYHNAKYFCQWRYFSCDSNIEIIVKHKKILDKRYYMLIDLLKLERVYK